MHHLRTHPLGLFDLPRHAADGNGGGGFDDPDRGGSGVSRNSALASTGTSAAASSANNRWSHGGLDRLDPIIGGGSGGGGGGGGGGGSNSRPDYRYTRVDRQRMVDSAVDTSGVTGGSRSVRSGLYAGEHQFTGEVCLSVSGLSGSGNQARGTVQVSGRTGKQVSFGRHSPDVSGSGNSAGTMERERSRESDKRLRSSGGAGGAGPVIGGGGVSSNKENSENSSRSTFPRSSIVASKRSSPERILATDRGRPSSRDDSADGRRRRPNSGLMTAETSLSLPDSRSISQHSRGGSGSGRRGVDGRDVSNRICSNNEPTFDELIDPKDLNLNEIARDCFIIPVHLVNRFLPLGVTVSSDSHSILFSCTTSVLVVFVMCRDVSACCVVRLLFYQCQTGPAVLSDWRRIVTDVTRIPFFIAGRPSFICSVYKKKKKRKEITRE
jgi:hypothetical protein